MLVEREGTLAVLQQAVNRNARHVLVAGEAGSGKTSVVRAFLEGLNAEWVLGSCDSLRTARPLGPFLDWPGEVDEVLRTVAVAVVEDVHWADDATLDLLARLARQNRPGTATLVLTYRDDEVGLDHPLRMLLGDLAAQSPVRVSVPRLTPAAVAELAEGSGLPAAELHAATGGNAFFVTECLASGAVTASANVRDAVLARTARLPAPVHEAVAAVSVVPGKCELWLAEALGADPAEVDAGVTAGALIANADGSISLRHELARLTVLEAMPPGRRRDLHRRAAAALEAPPVGPVDHARVVHHAVLGELPELVAGHVVAAAEAAVAAGARSQAVAHLETAVSLLPGSAHLWAQCADQLAIVGRDADAVDAYERAVVLARDSGDAEQLGNLLARLPGPMSTTGQLEQARAAAGEAVATLEQLPPSRALAMAYAQVAAQHMLSREFDLAEPWGRKAMSLAAELGDRETEAYAAIQSGVGLWMSGQEEGLARLHSGLELARRHGSVQLVGLALTQIGSGGGEIRRYDEAVPALREGAAWCEQHELGSRMRYAQAWLGRCLLELGRWDEAAQVLEPLLASPRTEAITRVTALTALGRLRARRGDPGASDLLDAALAAALPTGQLQRIWPVASARAELAWLSGSLDAELALVQRAHAMAVAVDYPWALDDLAFWLRQAGVDAPPSGRTPATPQDWRVVGCPYEEALALEVDGLPLLERLGAAPAARLVAQRRRAAGLAVPRGPNAATLGNPAGLTSRELEVLRHVADGRTNKEIAGLLHLSTKTVGHHVSHVLEKLAVRTRTEAVSKAVVLGLPMK